MFIQANSLHKFVLNFTQADFLLPPLENIRNASLLQLFFCALFEFAEFGSFIAQLGC